MLKSLLFIIAFFCAVMALTWYIFSVPVVGISYSTGECTFVEKEDKVLPCSAIDLEHDRYDVVWTK